MGNNPYLAPFAHTLEGGCAWPVVCMIFLYEKRVLKFRHNWRTIIGTGGPEGIRSRIFGIGKVLPVTQGVKDTTDKTKGGQGWLVTE